MGVGLTSLRDVVSRNNRAAANANFHSDRSARAPEALFFEERVGSNAGTQRTARDLEREKA